MLSPQSIVKDFDRALSRFEASIRPNQVWAVLDVDRTIINTTSWYRACSTPGLLIDQQNISNFLELNDQAYGSNPTLTDRAFRDKTLRLLRPTDAYGLCRAGRALSDTLHCYKEPYQYLTYLQQLYGDRLRIVYLSAGFKPFIEGVVDCVHAAQACTGTKYQVFGSGIAFNKGRGTVTFVCDREAKQRVVRAIVKHARIVFLADDDVANKPLFDIVRAQGGKTLPVTHTGSKQVSPSWADFITKQLAPDVVLRALQSDDSSFAPYDTRHLRRAYTAAFKKFAHINKIGIIALPNRQYRAALTALIGRVTSGTDKQILKDIFGKLVFASAGQTYLRGKAYYYWLPPYIFVDPRPNYEKWLEQLTISQHTLAIITKHKIISNWSQMDLSERLLIIAIADHYKNAIIHALNTLHFTSIKESGAVPSHMLAYLDANVSASADFYYQLIFDVPDTNTLRTLAATADTKMLAAMMKRWQRNQQGMRELDDPRIITLSALSILTQMEARRKRYDYIIDFPCGGLELGIALNSIHKIVHPRRKLPNIVHCFYSSKKTKRQRDFSDYREKDGVLFDFTPRHYHDALRSALDNRQSVLLYDNNTATFSTLASMKTILAEKYNVRADTAVATVWYENIARNLLGHPKAEPLNPGWRTLLDYRPVDEYIPAFNTWGTSAKGRIIEDTYFSGQEAADYVPALTTRTVRSPIFKVCRVHNIYDLTVALQHGANAIGIHAVSPDRTAYYESQRQYVPIITEPNHSELPIASYECESIKKMQPYVPAWVKQVVLFERPLSMTAMKQSIAAYGLNLKTLTIQLHHRLTQEYLRRVRTICPRIVAAIGASQTDFPEYFDFLQDNLDPATDHILVDLSKHQPDLITRGIETTDDNPTTRLARIAPAMQHNKVPVLLAEDTDVSSMKRHLHILKNNGVWVGGMDMQNNLEVPPNEQRFRLLSDGHSSYQARIRKTSEHQTEWRSFALSKDFQGLTQTSKTKID